MAIGGRPWSAAAAAVAGLAGLLAVSGFGAQRSSASGGAQAMSAARSGVAATTGSWGKAITLRAPASSPTAISCSAPGNCGAVGGLGGAVYVANQVRGTWGKPIAIPGTARTSKPSSGAAGIACFSVGGCVVVGSYLDTFGHHQAFIATQVRGKWSKLMWVPGLARMDRGNNAGLGELSCPSAGNCTAIGSYTDAKGAGRSFVVSQARGVWGHALSVPHLSGLPGMTPGAIPGFGPISCASAGNCAAGGTYPVGAPGSQNSGHQAYLDNEVHGVWGTPMPVPGLVALNTGLEDGIAAISCPSAGGCSAAGSYTETQGNSDSFVVNETHGVWSTAIEVKTKIPGFNGPDGDWITALECPSAGSCLAGGVDNVERDALASSVFIVSEVNGKWGLAIPVPGSDKANQGDQGWINQISCPSAGNCGIAGYYSAADAFGFVYTQPFVITQARGVWGKFIKVPGIKTLDPHDGQSAGTTAIACPGPNRCSAGGYYQGGGFVDSQP